MRPHVEPPYDPLDKRNLAESVVRAMLERNVEPLPPGEPFLGAGIYALYYTGPFPAYQPIAEANRDGRFAQPIYVGRAIPAGGRRGVLKSSTANTALYTRLSQHGMSVQQALDLELDDFRCRFLVVDDIWIPLAENLLIETFRPLWNIVIDGFGNHDPGGGRTKQKRSAWDELHAGRAWADRLQPYGQPLDRLMRRINAFLSDPRLAQAMLDEALLDEARLGTEDDGGII
jgi:hypothetical protein